MKSTSLDVTLGAARIWHMEKEIHPIQTSILRALLFRESARFSEMNTENISTDRFTFHLKQLVDAGMVFKIDDQNYALTTKGKEFANRFDVDSGPAVLEKQAKLGVLVVAMKEEDGKRWYLMQNRQKQPFFGFRGFITGKIKRGESVAETAARELLEEAGLTAEFEHKAVYHERIFLDGGELFEDKYFFVFLAEDPKGTLIEKFEGGINEWIAEDDVLSGNIFYDIADLLDLAHGASGVFAEKSYTVEKH